MIKNARFWVWECDGWIKLTLKPSQSLSYYRGGPTDEGWYSEATEWSFDGETVTRETSNDGVDCDGRMSYNSVYVCPVGELKAEEAGEGEWVDGEYVFTPNGIMKPNWQKKSARQRDYEAEKAGY